MKSSESEPGLMDHITITLQHCEVYHLVDLVNCFNTTLKSITDKHAPLAEEIHDSKSSSSMVV